VSLRVNYQLSNRTLIFYLQNLGFYLELSRVLGCLFQGAFPSVPDEAAAR